MRANAKGDCDYDMSDIILMIGSSGTYYTDRSQINSVSFVRAWDSGPGSFVDR